MSTLELHDYQHMGVAHLHAHPRSALWLDMGLGKTATVLRALRPADLPALVLAPKRVAEQVWPVEAAKWRPDLTVVLVTGSPAERAKLLESPADVHVISRDLQADALPRAGDWRTLVIDEASGYKSRTSGRWKSAKKLVQGMSNVWELTGTPSPNGYMDLWSQIYLLDGGERLGKTITAYRDRYFRPGMRLPNGVVTEWLIREGSAEAIQAKLADICMSMKAVDYLKLQPTTYNTVHVPLDAAVRKLYKTITKEFVVNLDMLGVQVTAGNSAALSNRQSQLAAGFLYDDEQDGSYHVIHREKLAALAEIVEGTGSPVLVFYRYIAEREMIQTHMPHARGIDEPGVLDAWGRGEIPVMLAHPASAGHGLNLQYGGHTIVWASLTWSLEEYMQGNGRLSRQGQPQHVVIHRLVSPGTVDEAMTDRLGGKKTVQQALMDHVKSIL